MADVIAVVSKAVFEPEIRKHGLAVGKVWPTHAYVSQNKGLSPLAGGGRLFLVTVRPPDEKLWLVAVLDQPKSDGSQWAAAANAMPVRDLSSIKKSLRFESGQGLPDKPGVLGMSLQTPRVLAATDIPLLYGDASAAAAIPPAEPRPVVEKTKKTKAKSEPPPAAPEPPPAPELPKQAPKAQFESVVDAWRRTRHPKFAALAEALSSQEPERPALGATGKKVDVEKWIEIERANDWRDLPRLMATLGAGNSPIAGDRVTLLARRDDPRLIPVLLHLLENPPFTAGSSRRFWMTLISTLTISRDVRARHGMADLAKRYKPINDTVMGATIAASIAKAAREIQDPPPLSASDDASLKALTEQVPIAAGSVTPGAPAGATTEEMFGEIVRNLDDDAARLIYADMLSEKGDPRGEFIVLQVERAAGRGSVERSDLERDKYTRTSKITEFGVPISTAAEKVEFERGFPVAISLARTGLQVVVDAPEWGTVKKITQIGYAPAKAFQDFVNLGTAPNLEALSTIPPKNLDKLKPATLPWKDVTFILTDLLPKHLERFPKLTHLRLVRAGRYEAALFAMAPNLVEVELGELNGELEASLFERNPQLTSLILKQTIDSRQFDGLRLTNLEIRDDWGAARSWLDAIPTVKTLSVVSRDRADWAALPRIFERRPNLESVRHYFGRIPIKIERSGDGFSLTVLPEQRWGQFHQPFIEHAAAMKAAGFVKLIVFADGPRHRTPPLPTETMNALRQAWGDAVEAPDLL
jgi:uncharacterized protein (TIGR02996 family)